MTDIHAHILPGLDDGAQDMQETMQMAAIAVASGVHQMAATPHCSREWESGKNMAEQFRQTLLKVRQKLEEEHLELELFPGMEIFFTEDLPQKIKGGEVIALNHSRYYLVEFPFSIHPGRLWQNMQSLLQMDGVVPVLAHPERYYCVQSDPELVYELVMDGALTQLNKGSITGKFGRAAYRTAMELLEYNLAGCVASDAHGADMRTPDLRDVKSILAEYYSVEYAQLLLQDNPQKILQNENVVMRAAARPVQKRCFL